jgi:hypothetical protein
MKKFVTTAIAAAIAPVRWVWLRPPAPSRMAAPIIVRNSARITATTVRDARP